MDTKKRTGIKVAIWGGIAFSITIISAYAIDHKIDTSLQIAAIDCVIKVIAHVTYERTWQHIQWGKIIAPKTTNLTPI